MTSLYLRASPPQARILRIVEGAVKNAADVHPEIQISARHRRSIAKRAAGTLSAQWPEVLAALAPSDIGDSENVARSRRRRPQTAKASGRQAAHFSKPLPLKALTRFLAHDLTALKAAGQVERAQAFIDVLRFLSTLKNEAREGEGASGSEVRATTNLPPALLKGEPE